VFDVLGTVVDESGSIAELVTAALAAAGADPAGGSALAGHRLRPWPDAAAALRELAGSFTVVALSNASVGQLADMFAAGGLAWHGVLSGERLAPTSPIPPSTG
jgi:2-haloacid dehalogenase